MKVLFGNRLKGIAVLLALPFILATTDALRGYNPPQISEAMKKWRTQFVTLKDDEYLEAHRVSDAEVDILYLVNAGHLDSSSLCTLYKDITQIILSGAEYVQENPEYVQKNETSTKVAVIFSYDNREDKLLLDFTEVSKALRVFSDKKDSFVRESCASGVYLPKRKVATSPIPALDFYLNGNSGTLNWRKGSSKHLIQISLTGLEQDHIVYSRGVSATNLYQHSLKDFTCANAFQEFSQSGNAAVLLSDLSDYYSISMVQGKDIVNNITKSGLNVSGIYINAGAKLDMYIYPGSHKSMHNYESQNAIERLLTGIGGENALGVPQYGKSCCFTPIDYVQGPAAWSSAVENETNASKIFNDLIGQDPFMNKSPNGIVQNSWEAKINFLSTMYSLETLSVADLVNVNCISRNDNTPNNVPNNDPNDAPNDTPSDAPNNAPNDTQNDACIPSEDYTPNDHIPDYGIPSNDNPNAISPYGLHTSSLNHLTYFRLRQAIVEDRSVNRMPVIQEEEVPLKNIQVLRTNVLDWVENYLDLDTSVSVANTDLAKYYISLGARDFTRKIESLKAQPSTLERIYYSILFSVNGKAIGQKPRDYLVTFSAQYTNKISPVTKRRVVRLDYAYVGGKGLDVNFKEVPKETRLIDNPKEFSALKINSHTKHTDLEKLLLSSETLEERMFREELSRKDLPEDRPALSKAHYLRSDLYCELGNFRDIMHPEKLLIFEHMSRNDWQHISNTKCCIPNYNIPNNKRLKITGFSSGAIMFLASSAGLVARVRSLVKEGAEYGRLKAK